MLIRTISALLALPILFLVLIKGGLYLFVAAFIICIVGQYEFHRAFNKSHDPIVALGYVMTVLWFLGLYFEFTKAYETLCIMLYLFALMTHMVFSKREGAFYNEMIGFMGFFYVVFTISHIILISKLGYDILLWYPFVLAFTTDTFAYLTGKLFGKHKLIPSVSPNKTVEGAVGGVVLSTLIMVVFAYVFTPKLVWFALGLGLVGSPLSMVGDLIASRMKRITKIKDFGNIMPGHGGVLDRFDSLIVTIPLVYYMLILFDKI